MRIGLRLGLLFITVATASLGAPAATSPLSSLGLTAGSGSLSLPLQIAISLTLLVLLPAVLMSITPFLRIVIVLHFLRQALGTQSTPSNQVLIGLALFLTILVMQPVLVEIYVQGWQPMERGELTSIQAFDKGSQPLRVFLTRFVREPDAQLFLKLTHAPAPSRPMDLPLNVLIPAYILSELKTGFQIG